MAEHAFSTAAPYGAPRSRVQRYVERHRILRRALIRAELIADTICAKLDVLEGDPDFEPGGDDEPSLTFTVYRGVGDDDREDDSADAEHTLGWSERASLNGRLGLGSDDQEQDDDREPDPCQGGFL